MSTIDKEPFNRKAYILRKIIIEQYTFRAVGAELGISGTRVQQIFKKTLRIFRHLYIKNGKHNLFNHFDEREKEIIYNFCVEYLMKNKYITTSSLARLLTVNSGKLFTFLSGMGWLEKIDGYWTLTEKGKEAGGIYKRTLAGMNTPVWPESFKDNPIFAELPKIDYGDIKNGSTNIQVEASVSVRDREESAMKTGLSNASEKVKIFKIRLDDSVIKSDENKFNNFISNVEVLSKSCEYSESQQLWTIILVYKDRAEIKRYSLKQSTNLQNKGKPWSESEDELLISEFDSGTPKKVIAANHGRTRGAITSRLLKLGKIERRQIAT